MPTPASEQKKVRAPILCVLGHIDHGKTSILDFIRGTVVQKHEVAGITQHIGASFLPIDDIVKFCAISDEAAAKLVVPGLLVIDTPGHAAFYNLRKRGGGVANIAILVIEVGSGPMPITWEAVRILRDRKVPFVIAANKLDTINGWKTKPGVRGFRPAFAAQSTSTQELLDEKIYQWMADFAGEGFKGVDRYDRIKDFTQNIAVVPTSARTGEGIPDLLMVLIGLVQQYLQKNIQYTDGPAKGVVLEVKNMQGLGTTLDAIVYDGFLKKNDTIVVGTLGEPVQTKIKALLQPKPMDEIRDPRFKFNSIDSVHAAAGIKIAAQNLEGVIAGAPFMSASGEEARQRATEQIRSEMQEIAIQVEDKGVVLKADSIGSLEAIVKLFRENGVSIRRAGVGDIAKKDVTDAAASQSDAAYLSVVLGFDVKILPDAMAEANKQGIRIFTNDVIYRLMEDYKAYVEKVKEDEKLGVFSALIKPGVLKVMPEYVFRRSNPAVFGVKVEKGAAVPKIGLVNQDGEGVGKIHQIQANNESVKVAGMGQEIAISINDVTFGRQVKETDTLYIAVPESHVRVLRTKFRDDLRPDELSALLEYVEIMRKKESAWWGV
ncbi:MAG: translation initiation factor IF-2 [Candidatus Lokiarchaeota archaeon]|nr:translation initiation factor IF-2 [Candidatus Lokiarchaeota archaeon]